MNLKNYLITTTFLFLLNSIANAAVIKSIDFEGETVGAAPTTSTSNTGKINNINFGDPVIQANGSNQYLEFNQSNNDRTIQNQLYDQVRVGTYAYESSVRLSFDMFLGDSSATAVLFFDNPIIQRFDFMGNGTIKAHNIDPSSRLPGIPVTYSNIFNNTYDVSTYDFTQWHNYIFDIDYSSELVNVSIDNTFAFSASIFSQSAGTNSVRFTTVSNTSFGVDNILLETKPSSIPEASSVYLLAFGLLGLFGVARRKV